MMEEARQDTLWVPQREDAYKAHGEILRRFSQNKVPGISIQRRWRREAQVWGFLVERGFCMKDGEHSFEDDLALLVAKENMIRIKAFCGMAESCGIEACLAAAADTFYDGRLYRIEGDICSSVWRDEEKRCARFQLAADRTGKTRIAVYMEERNLTAADRETLAKLKLDGRVTVSGTLALYGGAVQFQGCAVERMEGPSDYRKWCREEATAFQKWLETEGSEEQRALLRIADREKERRFIEKMGTWKAPCRVGLIAPKDSQGAEDFKSRLPHGTGRPFMIVETKNVNFAQAGEIGDAIKAFIEERCCDCIAIVRGGGDRYGMNAFQTAELAKAIAASSLPVVLGVGHTQDEFLCEKAAHLPCRTPTDAAAALDEASKKARKKESGDKKTWQEKIDQCEEMIKQLKDERDESLQEAERLRKLLETERAQWAEEKAHLKAAVQQRARNRRDADSHSAAARFRGFLRRK